MGEIGVEARVPTALSDGRIVEQVGDLVDTRAKAGRADHGAIGAREASIGDIFPMGVIQTRQECFA